MGIWEILGIAPTRDRRAIEQAYAQQRRFADPQLDPESWQRLQQAYKEALQEAAGEPQQQPPTEEAAAEAVSPPPAENVSPEAEMKAGQVMTELEALYSNPGWRNDIQRWRAQLEGERAHKEGVTTVLRRSLLDFLARQAQSGEPVVSQELMSYLSERLEWPRYRAQLEQQLGEAPVSRVLGAPESGQPQPQADQALAGAEAEDQPPVSAQGFGMALIGWMVALMILSMVFGELLN